MDHGIKVSRQPKTKRVFPRTDTESMIFAQIQGMISWFKTNGVPAKNA